MVSFTLDIDQSTCIRCGKCVRICPANIFVQPVADATVEVHNRESCIKCGHCVAICPTDSVKHSVFPPAKVHPINRELLPTPEQMMELMLARRSNRAFSRKPVPEEYFNLILRAAHRAPTASNQQELEFTLVTDPEKLKSIIDLTINIFDEKIKNINNPVVGTVVRLAKPDTYKLVTRLNALVQAVRDGKDLILRGATSVIFIHSKPGSYSGETDANLAYQNGSLMAESLGVSQFYTGFVCRAIGEDKKKRFNELLGVEGTIHAGMGLGMPAFKFQKYIDKEDLSVRRL